MSRRIAVLRPQPGNRVTASGIEARGYSAIRMPLFEVRALAWDAPDADVFDALILTSANAIRHGGPSLSALLRLPVYAVGTATAEAARRIGFEVACVGTEGAGALVAAAGAAGIRCALHLAGRERTLEPGDIVAQVIPVYASEPEAPQDPARLAGSVALVQSARAGARLGHIVDAAGINRGGIVVVAVSARAAEAAGQGWERVVVPDDLRSEALIDAAIALAD